MKKSTKKSRFVSLDVGDLLPPPDGNTAGRRKLALCGAVLENIFIREIDKRKNERKKVKKYIKDLKIPQNPHSELGKKKRKRRKKNINKIK